MLITLNNKITNNRWKYTNAKLYYSKNNIKFTHALLHPKSRHSYIINPNPNLNPIINHDKQFFNNIHFISNYQHSHLLDIKLHAFVPFDSISENEDLKFQIGYLGTLLVLLCGAAFLIIRQILIRREMDETIKQLGESIRSGNATSEEYFELAAVLIRKKLFTQAIQNLEKALDNWDGNETETAQVHNAMGYSFFNMKKYDLALKSYLKAIELQPGYITARNNLADVYETQKKWQEAYDTYQEVLKYDIENKIATARSNFIKDKLEKSKIFN